MSTTLEHLQTVFSRYSSENLTCCACCHKRAVVQDLKGRPLTFDEFLEHFYSPVPDCKNPKRNITGTTDTFKHFLPRVFQIVSSELLERLRFLNWKSWPDNEIEAIENHILTEWVSGKYPHCFKDYLAFFSFSILPELWTEYPNFLKSTIAYWNEDDYFFRGYWEAEKTISEADKNMILTFLEKYYWEITESDPDQAVQVSKVINHFEWCKTHDQKSKG